MVEQLFDEYAAAFARGESPDVRAYLAQAPELAPLIEAFVASAEPPAPDEAQVALAEAWAEGASPLEALRRRRGLRLDDLVAALVGDLGLDLARASQVKRYVSELEDDTLSRRGVDRRVWAAWAETLRTTAETLLAWRPRPLPAAPAGALLRMQAP